VIGTPVFAGFISTAASSATYAVPMTTAPVPPGAVIAVFAGASGATAATGVTDTQGNTYTLVASSTSNEYLQAFTATAVTGLNPAAGDSLTVTFAAANGQNKNILAVAVTGCAAADIAVAANGSSASPAAAGTAAGGSEVIVACVQNAAAGGSPSFPASLTGLGILAPGGQQATSAAYGWVTRAGSASVSATVTSAPWAVIMLTFTAAPPVAAGTGSSPSGGAQLPPYPVLPSPRTWSANDKLLTPLLRADPGNALLLLANPPLFIGGQTITGQSVPSGADTPLTLDTELTDTWGAHAIPAKTVAPPLAGWYLAEGFPFLNTISSGTAIAGIQAVQGGVTASCDGGRASANGVNSPLPNVADLVQVNPATGDTIALYCAQTSGTAKTIVSAWFKAEWVAASSGTVVASPVPAAGWTAGGTVLLDAVTAGATTVIVSDPSGIAAGAVIALDYGNPAQESVTVSSVAGQTVVTSACAYPHPAQAPVSVPVSAAWMNQQVRDKIRFLAYRPIARLTTQGGSQSLPSQAWPAGTAMTWSDPSTAGYRCVDNFTGWSVFNPTRYTFPLPGTWHLYGQVYLADTSSPFTVSAGLAISGGTIWWGDRTLSAGSAGEFACATVRRVIRVAAGQYAEVYGSQGSGGSRTVQATAIAHSRMLAVWRGY
jgi:hypothetical protein